MEYQVYYVVPHIKYKRKKRHGFLWLKSKVEEKTFSFLDYGQILLADKNNETTAYDKYRLIIDSDKLREAMKHRYIDRKCFDVEYLLHTHKTDWIKASDLEENLTFEELTLYKKQILKE